MTVSALMQLRLQTQNSYSMRVIAELLDRANGEDLAANMMVGLYGLASQLWMTLSLLKRPDNSLPIITGIILFLELISRTMVVLHMLRRSGPGSSKELQKCISLIEKSQESPLTIIQRGMNTPADMSLKAETYQEDQVVQATSVATGMVEATETEIAASSTQMRAPITQELATEASGLRLSRLAMVMRSSLSASESGFAIPRPHNILATIATEMDK